jgi:hypothetical protein
MICLRLTLNAGRVADDRSPTVAAAVLTMMLAGLDAEAQARGVKLFAEANR